MFFPKGKDKFLRIFVETVVNDKKREAKHVQFYEESPRTFEMTFYLSTFIISFVVYKLAE